MENISSWASTVCLAALGCSAILVLVPQNSVGKVFRLVISAILMLSMVRPLTNITFPEWSSWKTLGGEIELSELGVTVEEQLCLRIEQAVSELCNASYPNAVQKVETVTDISETGAIYMKCLRIRLSRETAHQKNAIKTLVEKETGLSVETEIVDE